MGTEAYEPKEGDAFEKVDIEPALPFRSVESDTYLRSPKHDGPLFPTAPPHSLRGREHDPQCREFSQRIFNSRSPLLIEPAPQDILDIQH